MLGKITDKIGVQLIGNSVWLLVEKILKLVIGLYVGVEVARYLGPEEMGLWNYGISLFLFFYCFSTLGLDYTSPRDFLMHKENDSVIFSNILILRLFGAVLGMVAPLIYFSIFEGPDQRLFLIMLILTSAFLFQVFDVIEYYFQAYLKSERTVIAKLIAFILVAAYKLYLVKTKASLLMFVASSTLEFLIAAIALIFAWSFFKDKIRLGKINWSIMPEMLKNSLPFSVGAILAVLHFRIDQVIITTLLGEAQNGIYSVSVRILELILFLLAVVLPSFLPVLTDSFKSSKELFSSKLKQYYSLVTWLAIIAMIGTLIVSKPMMYFLYGEKFTGSGEILQLLAICLYPLLMGLALSNYLIVTNQRKFNLIRIGVGFLLNVALNFWLIPKIGIEGAAISSICSNTFSSLLIVFFPTKHNHAHLFLQSFNLKYILKVFK